MILCLIFDVNLNVYVYFKFIEKFYKIISYNKLLVYEQLYDNTNLCKARILN